MEKISDLRKATGCKPVDEVPREGAKTDAPYKWKYKGNKIQFNFNTENLENLVQTLWAINNMKVDYAQDVLFSTIDKMKHCNDIVKLYDTS